jgi:hypothetical protein
VLTRWATLGRIRGLEMPLLSPARPASGWRPSKSKDLFPVLLCMSARVLSFY